MLREYKQIIGQYQQTCTKKKEEKKSSELISNYDAELQQNALQTQN